MVIQLLCGLALNAKKQIGKIEIYLAGFHYNISQQIWLLSSFVTVVKHIQIEDGFKLYVLQSVGLKLHLLGYLL
jgi:hypothetical protein